VVNVIAPAGQSVQIQLGGARPPTNPPNTDVVFMTELVNTSGAIATTTLEQFTVRKSGRPFGLRRGRARTLLSLRP
jgi:hypothetical protein